MNTHVIKAHHRTAMDISTSVAKVHLVSDKLAGTITISPCSNVHTLRLRGVGEFGVVDVRGVKTLKKIEVHCSQCFIIGEEDRTYAIICKDKYHQFRHFTCIEDLEELLLRVDLPLPSDERYVQVFRPYVRPTIRERLAKFLRRNK